MKVIEPKLVKHEIAQLIDSAREFINIASYSIEITPVELYYFYYAVRRGVIIDLVVGKDLHDEAMSALAKLYNIKVVFLVDFHTNVYQNESSVISTSCNFGRLNTPRLHESGVLFTKKDFLVQYRTVERQYKEYVKSGEIKLPRLPFKPDKPCDYFDLLKCLQS